MKKNYSKMRKNFKKISFHIFHFSFNFLFCWKRGLSEILSKSVKMFYSKFHQNLSFRQDLAKLKGFLDLGKSLLKMLNFIISSLKSTEPFIQIHMNSGRFYDLFAYLSSFKYYLIIYQNRNKFNKEFSYDRPFKRCF